jgi:hypothetical protein
MKHRSDQSEELVLELGLIRGLSIAESMLRSPVAISGPYHTFS